MERNESKSLFLIPKGTERNESKSELLWFEIERNGTKRNRMKQNELKSQFAWNETERKVTNWNGMDNFSK